MDMQQLNSQAVKLHVFCDSGERAYYAVAYLQGKTNEGNILMSSVASKSRLAPLKRITLPCLEFVGAVIAARLGNKQLHLWTDSMIVLHWI